MEKRKLISAVRCIAWGYVFLHLNFNLGTLNVLPGFVGYALIVSALPDLAKEGRPSRLLRPLGIGLGVWDAVVWGFAFFGVTVELPIIDLIAGVVGLYFHFQLLTDLSAVAEACDCPQGKRLLALRTARTILMAVMLLPIPWESVEALSVLLLAANLVVVVWLCVLLFGLQSALRDHFPGGEGENGENTP